MNEYDELVVCQVTMRSDYVSRTFSAVAVIVVVVVVQPDKRKYVTNHSI